MFSTFKESERLRRVFMEASGGSFRIVYFALVGCSLEAKGAPLKESDVLDKIALARGEE